jgi:hypothetical protein
MKTITRVALLLALVSVPLAARNKQPKISSRGLDADQVAIYRIFLQSHTSIVRRMMNLANTTQPLNTSSLRFDRCTQGVKLKDLGDTERTVHAIGHDVAKRLPVNLVDQAQQAEIVAPRAQGISTGKTADDAAPDKFAFGYFTVSEIAFDKDRTVAVMQYAFRCGPQCGHGATLMFQRTKAGWVEVQQPCSSWIS